MENPSLNPEISENLRFNMHKNAKNDKKAPFLNSIQTHDNQHITT